MKIIEQSRVQQIMKALELYSVKIDQKIDGLKKQMDKRFDSVEEHLDQVENRLERVEKKLGGTRVEITETQESVEFLLTKSAQHEKKLRAIHEQ